jgi:WD40 repeat protein
MKLPTTALCLAAHSSLPHVAAGLVLGGVAVGLVGVDSPVRITPLPDSIRAIAYASYDTSASAPLFAASDTGRLYQLDPESIIAPATYFATPESAPLSAVASFEPHTVIAGDDDGGLHLFDTRIPSSEPIASILEQGDYISAIRKISETLLAVASGDGSLGVYDIRRPPHARLKLVAATPTFDDDLLSLALLGNGERAAGGTMSGAVNVYNLKLADADENEPDMSRYVDRFYGHPESVSAILSIDEHSVVLTGSSDGIIRVIDPIDKMLLGVLPYIESPADGEDDENEDCETHTGDLSAAEIAAFSNVKTSCIDDESEAELSQDDEDEEDDENGDDDQDKHGDDMSKDGKIVGSRTIAWPVEGMAFVNGLSKSQIAVIGHGASIRFCDASLLDDDDDDDEDDDEATGSTLNINEGDDAATAAVKPSKKSLLQNDDAKADFERASRATKRRRKGGAASRPSGQTSFFKDL